MTVTILSPGISGAASPRVHGLVRKVSDVIVLMVRNLIHISREPFSLSDVTIQPVLFTLLFIYVFGAGVVLPGGASYKDFAIPGLLVFNQVTATVGTGVGLSTDVNTGLIDRFRTLPMWRPSVLVARSVTDLLTAVIGAGIVAATGFAIGWSPNNGVGPAIGGFALVLLFGYALSWGCACLGLVSKGVETAQSFGLLVLFSPDLRLQRSGPHSAHDALAARHDQLEPDQLRRGGRAAPLRQPKSLGVNPGLAHATSCLRVAHLVDRAPLHLRPPGGLPLPPTRFGLNRIHHPMCNHQPCWMCSAVRVESQEPSRCSSTHSRHSRSRQKRQG
jgi:hypothetical protein